MDLIFIHDPSGVEWSKLPATLFTKNPPDFSTSETFTFSVGFLLGYYVPMVIVFFGGNLRVYLETPGLEVPSSSPRARSSQVPGSRSRKPS